MDILPECFHNWTFDDFLSLKVNHLDKLFLVKFLLPNYLLPFPIEIIASDWCIELGSLVKDSFEDVHVLSLLII